MLLQISINRTPWEKISKNLEIMTYPYDVKADIIVIS